jgi:ABC-type Co2+ transport system permease subunit
MEISYLAKIIIALLLGGAVGFERESYENRINKTKTSGRGSLGVRSYALISLLGVLSGLIYKTYTPLFIAAAVAFVLLFLGYYILGSLFNRDNGITTELAILLNFLFGIFLLRDLGERDTIV